MESIHQISLTKEELQEKMRIQKSMLSKIMTTMIENNINFDFINNVLYSDSLPNCSLWLYWGEILIAPKDAEGMKAGDMCRLFQWAYNEKEKNFIINNEGF